MLALPIILSACGGSGGDDTPSTQAGAPLTSNVTHGYWPPQPLGATDIVPLPASALGGAQSLVLDAARRTVLANPTVQASLGEHYQTFDASLGNQKDGVIATFLFYNYDSDETIAVDLQPDGNIVRQVHSASSYQPQEHPDESEAAVSLARSALDNLGFATAELQGTALLAFPKTQDIANPAEPFHTQRMLYVTFGSGNGAIPVYSAIVNLSNGAVSEAGLVK